MEKSIKKIVVLGPESTGKSSLCKALAAHYDTAWVREYAREYLEKKGVNYTFEDLYKIAIGHLEGEDEITKKVANAIHEKDRTPVFVDTDLHVIKIWSEFVFNKCDNRILSQLSKRKYDLFLLCDVDLPWIKDDLREYPDLKVRQKLFHYYKEEMAAQNIPWQIISGDYDKRFRDAVKFTDAIL